MVRKMVPLCGPRPWAVFCARIAEFRALPQQGGRVCTEKEGGKPTQIGQLRHPQKPAEFFIPAQQLPRTTVAACVPGLHPL